VPRPHAWLSTIANDVVVDFTGPPARRRYARKYPPMLLGDFSERSYFGVALPRDLVYAPSALARNDPGLLARMSPGLNWQA